MILADQRHKSLCFLAALAWSALTVVSAGAPPPNDRFAEATQLVGAPVTAQGSTADATHEQGEPVVPGNTAGQSVWWTWTAPADGQLTLTVAEENYSTALAVFGGEDLGSLQLLGDNQSIWSNLVSREMRMRGQLSLTVAAGRQYHIAADWNSYVPASWVIQSIDPGPICIGCPPPVLPPVGGPVTFTLGFVPAPTNDSFAQAGDVSGKRAELAADTTGSNREPGEPDGLFHTVWWRWTAPYSGLLDFGTDVPAAKPAPTTTTVRARLPVPSYNDPLGWPAGVVISIGSPTNSGGSFGSSGSGTYGAIFTWNNGWNGSIITIGSLFEQNPPPPFTPAVRLFAGTSLADLQLLAGGPLAQTNHVRVEGGQTYYFALGSLTDAVGPAAFQFQLTAPENDSFADRITITGVEASATGHNVGATTEPGEPAVDPAGHSAWWTWTAPDDCVAEWIVSGTNFPAMLTIYRGSALAGLQRIDTGFDLTVRVAQGDVLQLAVDGFPHYFPMEGDYTLTLKAEAIAPELAAVPRRNADGSQQFRVNHLRGRGILIYAAASFGAWPSSAWQPLWAGVVNADSATFLDYTAAGAESRYYVVRLAQPGEEKWFIPPPPSVVAEANASNEVVNPPSPVIRKPVHQQLP